MESIEKQFQAFDMALTYTLMTILIAKRYDDVKGM